MCASRKLGLVGWAKRKRAHVYVAYGWRSWARSCAPLPNLRHRHWDEHGRIRDSERDDAAVVPEAPLHGVRDTAKYSAIMPSGADGLARHNPVQWANRASGDNDVEISAGPGAAGLAGGRASQIGAEDRGRTSRSLCADRAYRGRQAGLLNEMRNPAGAAPAASGGAEASAAAGRRARTGDAAERHFRLVLRPQVMRPRPLR